MTLYQMADPIRFIRMTTEERHTIYPTGTTRLEGLKPGSTGTCNKPTVSRAIYRESRHFVASIAELR